MEFPLGQNCLSAARAGRMQPTHVRFRESSGILAFMQNNTTPTKSAKWSLRDMKPARKQALGAPQDSSTAQQVPYLLRAKHHGRQNEGDYSSWRKPSIAASVGSGASSGTKCPDGSAWPLTSVA